MPTIKITITGGKETQAKLKRLGESLLNFDTAMHKIGRDLQDYYGDKPFLTRGGIYGEGWSPLKPATMRAKAKKYPTYASYPLIASGAMMRAFTFDSGPTFALIYNTDPKFDYHQLGTSHIPQRVVLALDDEVNRIIKTDIENDIRVKIERA